jgi:Right handed beta helix region
LRIANVGNDSFAFVVAMSGAMNGSKLTGFQIRHQFAAIAALMVLVAGRTALAASLVILPSSGASVSGVVRITVTPSAPVSWFNLLVDGRWIASNPIQPAPSYKFSWDSSRATRGSHVISVLGYNNSNQQIATAAVTVKVLPLTYYVAPGGSDLNDGRSRAKPWATVRKAAAIMVAGDKAMVAGGRYDAIVNVTASGTAAYPITFQRDGAAFPSVQDFQITANYIRVIGFEITNRNRTAPAGFGIYLAGSNAYIAGNYIHDLYFEGVMISGGGDPNSARTAHNSLVNNRFVRCGMAAAQIEGRNNLIQGNDVSYTRQYPAGGPRRSGADADGFRFFGTGHIFRANRIHDIPSGTAENPDPHTDCFQTWGPASGVIIERNFCVWPRTSPSIDNQAAMLSGECNRTSGITFRNNVFAAMRQGIGVFGASGVLVLNNTFAGILQEGLVLSHAPSSQIVNNIFYDVGSGEDSYACIDPASRSSVKVESNDHFVPGRAAGTYCSGAPHYTLDPLFAGAAALNFHLRSNSPLIDLGVALPQVANDYDGTPRPQGRGYDIGAFEYR